MYKILKLLARAPIKIIVILSLIITFTMLTYSFNYNTVYDDSIGKPLKPNSEESNYEKPLKPNSEVLNYKRELELHRQVVDRYYEKRRYWKTSNLGTILFKNIDSKWFSHPERENKTFSILIWSYYDWLKNRHVNNFQSTPRNPLEDCSVKNCIFLAKDTALAYADAVVIQTLRGAIPHVKERPSHQRWVFLSDESPMHTFTLAKKEDKPTLAQLANLFNWTMTYRSDSDIPVPYGRTLPLKEPNIIDLESLPAVEALKLLVPHWDEKQTEVPISILASNCMNHRMKFYEKLLKFLPIDMHGGCSKNNKNSCPGHIRADCPAMDKYIFYLVYENSKCRQYLTEKGFYHGYFKGAIPIIVGPPKSDCEKLLPPDSYIHIDGNKPEELAEKIKSILSAEDMYEQLLSYHKWRMHFQVVNEHGYFGTKSFHYCRVCEALNYNDGDKSIYDNRNLEMFFDPNLSCESFI